ncbi:hypothetical protein SODG_005899 [Sodalis praecaptivus]
MDIHLGYAKHDPAGNNSGNSRNGKTSKNVRSQNGELELQIHATVIVPLSLH